MPNILNGWSLFEQRRTVDDLPRLEARDIPDSGELPNGSKVVFGVYTHTIRGDQVMQRWMVQCPLCRRPCRVLYDLDGHFMCRRCVGMPYRSEISGRSERERGIPFLPITATYADIAAPEYQEARARAEAALQRDLRKDADYHNRRYHEKMRGRAAERLRRSCARDGYELPDVDSFSDAS